MKKICFISVLIFFLLFFVSCGPTIYKSKSFENSKTTIKKLAVLPFIVSIDQKRLPKGMTIETIKEAEKRTGYDVQNDSYKWFLQRQNNYTVDFQDVDKTNAILQAANIQYDQILLQDKGSLCKILNVDGVISGKINMSKPMSDGAAVALVVLAGAWGATNKTNAILTIHDNSGDLLWQYDYSITGSIGSTSKSLADALMKNASKKFPYKKN